MKKYYYKIAKLHKYSYWFPTDFWIWKCWPMTSLEWFFSNEEKKFCEGTVTYNNKWWFRLLGFNEKEDK